MKVSSHGELRLNSISSRFAKVALAAWVLGAGCVAAAELTVIAPNAVREAVFAIAGQYERASGNRIVFTWSGTEAITKRIGDGEVFDVVVNAGPNIDRLSGQGKLAAGSRIDFARSAIGVAVRSGQPHPDISSIDGLRRALLDAGSIAVSSGTSGRYLVELFQSLGIADQIRHKLKQPSSGAQIAELLAAGEAELGFQQTSELLHAKGIDFLGPLPAVIQHYTVYAAGRHVSASDPDAARAFMDSLGSSGAAERIRASGLEPL